MTGSAAIGTISSSVPAALLDLESTTQGLLAPRMTTTQQNAISSPPAGLRIYDSTLNFPSYYNGSNWLDVASQAGAETITNKKTRNISGTAAIPAYSFVSDASTGMFLTTTSELGLTAGGVQGMDMVNIGSSLINFGFGTAANGSSSVPFVAQRSLNAPVTWQYGNASTGTSSSTVFQIFEGTGSNYLTFENYANNTSNSYLGEGSGIFSSPNQTQFVIGSEGTSSNMAFDVGGRTLATERMRLTSTALTLNSAIPLILTGKTSGSVIFAAPNAAITSYSVALPTAQGGSGTYLGNDGSGNTSWTTPATGSYIASNAIVNAGLSCAVTSNSISFYLKQANGSSDPSSGTSAVVPYFRSTLAGTGQAAWATASVTGQLSVTVPGNAATLGQTSNVASYVWIYLLNDAGTVDICVNGGDPFDDAELAASTQISSSATVAATLYCNSSHSGSKPIRLIGRCLETETTAGTWASNCTSLDLLPIPKYNVSYGNTFTASITATGTIFGTNTQVAIWDRNGRNMHLRWQYLQTTAGTNGSSSVYELNMPNGLAIDTTVTKSSTGGAPWGIQIGFGSLNCAASPDYFSTAIAVYDSTHLYMSGQNNTTAIFQESQCGFSNNPLQMSWEVPNVPIAGWFNYGP